MNHFSALHLGLDQPPRGSRVGAWCGCMGLLVFSAQAQAQFDPTRVTVEAEAIARQFVDPATRFTTPEFLPGRQDFTSHAEVFGFLDALSRRTPGLTIKTLGRSQQGRAIVAVVLTGPRGWDAGLPTVMLLGQQHGNEPAGGEAALVLAQSLADERRALLQRANVVILPRANPDAAERFARGSANGIDINRGHLLVRTPELQAITAAVLRYAPQVMLDLYETMVAGAWASKFGALLRSDMLLQGATMANLNPDVAAAQQRYLGVARTALEAAGHRVDDYHTTSTDVRDLAVATGGVNADTGRNVGGLRNAVSLLLESRGHSLGRAHYARRVQSHVLAALAVIETAAQDGTALLQMQRQASAGAAAQACSGQMAVVVRQTDQRRTLSFLDAKTGEPRDVDVLWRSSHELQLERQRPRPCGYLIDEGQSVAVQRLRALGVQVSTVAPAQDQKPPVWEMEDYVVQAETASQRQEVRGGAIADRGETIRVIRVETRPQRLAPVPGANYVPMNQPLAALIAAALEPDSQNSFAANRLLDIDNGQLRRVMQPPPADALMANGR